MPANLLIVLILLIVSLTAGTVLAYVRIGFWKDRFEDQRAIYDDTLDRAMEAERELGRLEEEHTSLKTTFTGTLAMLQNRQSVVMMTDAQVNLISQTIAHLVAQVAGKNTLPN